MNTYSTPSFASAIGNDQHHYSQTCRKIYQQLRNYFYDYDDLLERDDTERCALAAALCTQIEWHMALAREIVLPAFNNHNPVLVTRLLAMQQDISGVIHFLRVREFRNIDGDLDLTMLRLMAVTKHYIKLEKDLLKH